MPPYLKYFKIIWRPSRKGELEHLWFLSGVRIPSSGCYSQSYIEEYKIIMGGEYKKTFDIKTIKFKWVGVEFILYLVEGTMPPLEKVWPEWCQL